MRKTYYYYYQVLITMISNDNSKTISLERESISTSSSIGNLLLTDRLGLEGKEREYRGNSLSLTLEKSFGISYKKTKTIRELAMLSKYAGIIDEMSDQKCFTMSYITALFDRNQNDKTIKILIEIMSKRSVLFVYKYQGKAKTTFGLPVYYTHEATEKDLQDTIRLYESYDDLRFFKEKQRKKKKRSPKDAVDAVMDHNKEVKRRTNEKPEIEDPNKCCDWKELHIQGQAFNQHICGKGVVNI